MTRLLPTETASGAAVDERRFSATITRLKRMALAQPLAALASIPALLRALQADAAAPGGVPSANANTAALSREAFPVVTGQLPKSDRVLRFMPHFWGTSFYPRLWRGVLDFLRCLPPVVLLGHLAEKQGVLDLLGTVATLLRTQATLTRVNQRMHEAHSHSGVVVQVSLDVLGVRSLRDSLLAVIQEARRVGGASDQAQSTLTAMVEEVEGLKL